MASPTRVLAADLGGGDQAEQLVARSSRRAAVTPVERRVAAGDGAGLVQHDGGEAAGRLQGLAAADQDAELGGLAGADHDRGRGGQAERAGAGDDQHGDGGADGEHQPVGVRAEDSQPTKVSAARRAGRRARTRRRPGRPGAASGAFEPWASSTRRTIWASVVSAPTAVGADDEGAGAVEGGADDGWSPGRLVDRHALAGEHPLVDGGRALDDDAVDGHLLAGPDPDQVADGDLLDGDVDSAPSRTTRAVVGARPIRALIEAAVRFLALAPASGPSGPGR